MSKNASSDLNLKMELVDVERILGGEKIVVYFLADQRVDFRQLVRDLAKAISDSDRDAADRRPR